MEIGEERFRLRSASKPVLRGGSEYFLIEQDTTYGRDPFESLRISKENLEKWGIPTGFYWIKRAKTDQGSKAE